MKAVQFKDLEAHLWHAAYPCEEEADPAGEGEGGEFNAETKSPSQIDDAAA